MNSLLSARSAVGGLLHFAQAENENHLAIRMLCDSLNTKNVALAKLCLIRDAIKDGMDCNDTTLASNDPKRLGPIVGRSWAEVAKGVVWYCLGPCVRAALRRSLPRPVPRWEQFEAQQALELFDEDGKPNSIATQAIDNITQQDWDRAHATVRQFADSGDLEYLIEVLTAEMQETTNNEPPKPLSIRDRLPFKVNKATTEITYKGETFKDEKLSLLLDLLIREYPKPVSPDAELAEYGFRLCKCKGRKTLPQPLKDLIDKYVDSQPGRGTMLEGFN